MSQYLGLVCAILSGLSATTCIFDSSNLGNNESQSVNPPQDSDHEKTISTTTVLLTESAKQAMSSKQSRRDQIWKLTLRGAHPGTEQAQSCTIAISSPDGSEASLGKFAFLGSETSTRLVTDATFALRDTEDSLLDALAAGSAKLVITCDEPIARNEDDFGAELSLHTQP